MSTSTTDQDAAKAFEDSVMGYQFLGMPLEKWNHKRQIAAQAMGMKAPGFTEEDIDAIRQGRAYAGALADAVIFFWILTRLDAEVRAARLKPAASYEQAEAWAESQGYADQQSAKWGEAYPLMIAILRGVQVSEFALKIDAGGGTLEKKEESPLV